MTLEFAAIVPIREPRDPEWPAAARLEEARHLARMAIHQELDARVVPGSERWRVLSTTPGPWPMRIGLRLDVDVEGG